MAYEHYPSAWRAKESSVIVFSENELPTAESSYALCKVSMHTLMPGGTQIYLLKLKVLKDFNAVVIMWLYVMCHVMYVNKIT